MNNILSCRNVGKKFVQSSGTELEIFQNISFDIAESETISIIGSSGSGKTSLLQILAGLDEASSGRVIIDNNDISQLSENDLCVLRRDKLGFIYQFHHLLPEFTALENTLMPSVIAAKDTVEKKEYAEYLLAKLGLNNRLTHYPNQLSGGERQRVAIARAVVNNPKLVFADEPTGNLDNNTAHQVLDMFFELQQELKTSLILVTHDMQIAARTATSYHLANGTLTQQQLA